MGPYPFAQTYVFDDSLIRGDQCPRRVRLVPTQLLPKTVADHERKQAKRRLFPRPKDSPQYFRGVDWRQIFKTRGPLYFPRALTPRDQENTDASAGFAVAHALRANIAIHRGIDFDDLNPFFIWGIARERVQRLWAGRSLLREALYVVNNHGTPSGPSPSYAQTCDGSFVEQIRKFAVEFTSVEAASQLKIQGIVEFPVYLGEIAAWLHAHGPVVVNMTLDRKRWEAISPKNPVLRGYNDTLAYDTELTKAYASHDVVVVGYIPNGSTDRHRDCFVIMNSYGPRWGDRGFAYVPFEEAQLTFRQAYGMLFREQLGFDVRGQAIEQPRSRLALDYEPPRRSTRRGSEAKRKT
jgi:hypothetical protein